MSKTETHHREAAKTSVKTTSSRVTRPEVTLRRIFLQRRERHPAYSQAAFARDLGISVSVLSRVLAGKRPMSLKFGIQVAAALGLNDQDTNAFLYSISEHAAKQAKISARMRQRLENSFHSQAETERTLPVYSTVEIERFKTIAQWYHLPILNLTLVEGFDPDPKWIAGALGISVQEARDALDRLFALGMLRETEDGRVERTQSNFFVKTQKSETAMRRFHSQMMDRAQKELRKAAPEDFRRRLMNGITFACGPEHLEAIKDRIDRFQDEILGLLDTGSLTAVYQMNVQFFPLTENPSPKENQE